MVVRYVSFKRLVHVLVKYMCMYRGWSQLCYSRDRVINHQFRFGEISPVVWDMTSSTRYRPENSRDDHKCFHVRFIDYRQGFARARFRQLVICDMTSSTRVFEGWPQMFFTWGLLITGKTLPGQDFASYLWHDFLDQRVRGMTTYKCFSRVVHWLPAILCQGKISPVICDMTVPRPDGLRDDHKDVIQVRILGGISPIGCQARHSVVRMSEISPQSLCWISNIWAKFRQWPMKSYSCSKFIWICGRDFARVRPRARFRQLFVK